MHEPGTSTSRRGRTGAWRRRLVAAVFVAAAPASAWGPAGHQLVCEIAFQELGDEAREEVKALIRRDPDFDTFAASCTWPDDPRQRDDEHYVNLPRSFTYVGAARCPMASRCLFTAIRQDSRALERWWTTTGGRLRALKFLGHWVGDIHQPLHVSFRDDRGGNSIIESEEPPCDGTLHRVWDSCILAERVIEGRSIRRVAQELRATLDAAERARLRDSGPVDWADESFRITRRDDVGYCTPREDRDFCAYDVGNDTLDRGEPMRGFHVDRAYLDRHGERVGRRVLAAGVRLAALLDELLDGT